MTSLIAAIKSALPLRAYLAEHGAEFVRDKARCLFHEDKTPSASLYRGKDGYERLKCFGCGMDVDVIGAAQELHGLAFKAALRFLTDRAGIKPARTQAEKVAAEGARRDIVKAFRRWEMETVNDIVEVLRRYRHLKSTRNNFTEAELQTLARRQAEIDELEYHYEILCVRDDSEKYELFKETMDYAD